MDGSRRWSNVIGTGIDPSPLKNKVLTVNGQAPDDKGNVDIKIPESGITEARVSDMISEALGVVENGTY